MASTPKQKWVLTDGTTALHVAVDLVKVDVVKLLLQNGADLEAQNKDGWTPLHYGCQRGDLDVVELLLLKGANPASRETTGMKPVDVAVGDDTKSLLQDAAKAFEADTAVCARRCKVVLVGPGDVGKTTLVKRLLTGNFDPTIIATHGVEVDEWALPAEGKSQDQCSISLWDLGGQDVYASTHAFFMTPGAVYCVLYRARNYEDDAKLPELEEYLDRIQTLAPGAPMLLVGTQAGEDSQHRPRPLKSLFDKYKDTLAPEPIFISSKTGYGLSDLSAALLNMAVKQAESQKGLPESFSRLRKAVSVAQRLVQRGENPLMPLDAFRRLSVNCGVDPSEMQRCMEALSQYGDLRYFKNVQAMPDMVVLRPQWLADLMTYVVTTDGGKRHKLQDQDGRVSRVTLMKCLESLSPLHAAGLVELLELLGLLYAVKGGDDVLVPVLMKQWAFKDYTNRFFEGPKKVVEVFVYGATPERLVSLVTRQLELLRDEVLFQGVKGCGACGEDQDLPFLHKVLQRDRQAWELLQPSSAPSTDKQLVEATFQSLLVCFQDGISQVCEKVDRVLVRQNDSHAYLARSLMNLYKLVHMLDEKKVPVLHVVLPEPPRENLSFRERWSIDGLLKQRFRLHLLCEWPGGEPHLTDHEGYKIKRPREWLTRNRAVLKVAMRLVEGMLRAGVMTLTKGISDGGLSGIGELVDKHVLDNPLQAFSTLNELLDKLQADPSGGAPQQVDMAACQSARREIVKLIEKVDGEANVYGKLQKVVGPPHGVMWLCKCHADLFKADQPGSAALQRMASLRK
ncbi:hypothetical protein GPECTOR_123g473 [Gonium pectorale]|uniref:non-specific serine/threonine protein kinase n=1 Tax=Gonium pectorale TaxID=33097 RepID=A0A150FYL9_GONPE|nr:hypothetical protein GPECTOR_123g473 [Gonium pectorale]|eukprot:KXZ42701.1 hypothetical protein GPECTOR_123g473 [Gonium pectorale]